ncbi:hypothetical protein C4K14_4025 [Pseudomonas chlororaphis subsp. aureofaciens]|uniref:integrating conjugative element protein n=1 Tax=Pseudomonas chlororaphis TaxID=587753 RepID=UPI000F578752|nr:integrating conjugative element protein [Pseudomonas chlororaphis]AZD86847.1 hypothetical protein C4K14_4025 [Pseudomonas chlororaphis subsp. aureofaciens]
MKLIASSIALGLAVWLSPATAQLPLSPLIVVDDQGGSTALPYYEAISPQGDSHLPAPITTPPNGYGEADMLPVRTPRLTPGPVVPRSIQAPGLTPVFLIGDDTRSRAWLGQRLNTLRQLGAVGLVVNVETIAALLELRALAPDLHLMPVSAEDLAQRLDLSRYPVLITATGIEQ